VVQSDYASFAREVRAEDLLQNEAKMDNTRVVNVAYHEASLNCLVRWVSMIL